MPGVSFTREQLQLIAGRTQEFLAFEDIDHGLHPLGGDAVNDASGVVRVPAFED